jgi:hypothetical protein
VGNAITRENSALRLTLRTTGQELYGDLLLGIVVLALALLSTATTLPLLVCFAPELVFALAIVATQLGIAFALGLCQPDGHSESCSGDHRQHECADGR